MIEFSANTGYSVYSNALIEDDHSAIFGIHIGCTHIRSSKGVVQSIALEKNLDIAYWVTHTTSSALPLPPSKAAAIP